uniref:Uncharacterized protein n=1 Tax=Tanacetum cinerariifolium TaxID=118510 RepID=A0A6L2N8J7_TANCI|nr:hypothetical protein [Tanacetum cinerariifolium]
MNKEVENVVPRLDLTGSSDGRRLEKLPNYVATKTGINLQVKTFKGVTHSRLKGCWVSDVWRVRVVKVAGSGGKKGFGDWWEALCITQCFKRGLDMEGVLLGCRFVVGVSGGGSGSGVRVVESGWESGREGL